MYLSTSILNKNILNKSVTNSSLTIITEHLGNMLGRSGEPYVQERSESTLCRYLKWYCRTDINCEDEKNLGKNLSLCFVGLFVLIRNLIYGTAAKYRKTLHSSMMWIWEYFMGFTTCELNSEWGKILPEMPNMGRFCQVLHHKFWLLLSVQAHRVYCCVNPQLLQKVKAVKEPWLLFLALFVYSVIVPYYCTWDVWPKGWRCSPCSLEVVSLEILHLDDKIVLLHRLYRENPEIVNII